MTDHARDYLSRLDPLNRVYAGAVLHALRSGWTPPVAACYAIAPSTGQAIRSALVQELRGQS